MPRRVARLGWSTLLLSAQKAAPKEVVFKCEDVDARGRDVGPVFVLVRGATSPTSPVEKRGWMRRDAAHDVASEFGTPLSIDC